MKMKNSIKKIGYHIIVKLISFFKRVEQAIMPAEAYILSTMTNGFIVSRCLSAVAELEVADYIDRVVHIDVLAKKTNCNSDALYRILRCLSSVGIFKENSNKRFSHSNLSLVLKKDSNKTVLNWLKYFNSKEQFEQWNDIISTIKNGKTVYENNFGVSIFDWHKENPEDQKLFHNAMQNISDITTYDIINSYDFSSVDSVMDIGGGNGSLLKGVLFNNTHLQGSVYDLFEKNDFSKDKNIQFINGDFFKYIPKGFDLYIMKSILHDWNDNDTIKILKNIKKSMHSKSRLLIIETLIGKHKNDFAKITDVAMLTLSGGKERTIIELKELIESSGLQIKKVIGTPTPFSLVEITL